VNDKKLKDYSLQVSRHKMVGRNPGWAKLYSKDTAGVINLVWHGASMILVGRVITKGTNKPDELMGQFVTYLLGRHAKRIKVINIFPE